MDLVKKHDQPSKQLWVISANKSSEPTRDSSAALRGECIVRAARLKRYASWQRFQEK
jgi:hypothetical protein